MARSEMTILRERITNETVSQLLSLLQKNLSTDIFQTDDNLSTLTWEVGEVDGTPLYGSIKFTLHKADYNLDDEIEKFEMKLEETEMNQKKREEREAEEARKKKERENAIAARRNARKS